MILKCFHTAQLILCEIVIYEFCAYAEQRNNRKSGVTLSLANNRTESGLILGSASAIDSIYEWSSTTSDCSSSSSSLSYMVNINIYYLSLSLYTFHNRIFVIVCVACVFVWLCDCALDFWVRCVLKFHSKWKKLSAISIDFGQSANENTELVAHKRVFVICSAFFCTNYKAQLRFTLLIEITNCLLSMWLCSCLWFIDEKSFGCEWLKWIHWKICMINFINYLFNCCAKESVLNITRLHCRWLEWWLALTIQIVQWNWWIIEVQYFNTHI